MTNQPKEPSVRAMAAAAKFLQWVPSGGQTGRVHLMEGSVARVVAECTEPFALRAMQSLFRIIDDACAEAVAEVKNVHSKEAAKSQMDILARMDAVAKSQADSFAIPKTADMERFRRDLAAKVFIEYGCVNGATAIAEIDKFIAELAKEVT